MKLISEETCIKRINAIQNISFIRWGGEYKGTRSTAICKCLVDGYEWPAKVERLVNRRSGCPQCGGRRRWTAEERIEQINSLPNITFVRWESEYKGSASKAVCRCNIDGFEWAAVINNLTRHGSHCPHCSRVRKWTAEERIEQINSLPNITFVRWDSYYKDSTSKAVCRCEIDGYEWAPQTGSLLSGRGCPQCAGQRMWTAEERIEQINAKPNIEFVRWAEAYNGVRSRALCRCALDGYEWVTEVNILINSGSGCPQCSGRRIWTADERIAQINSKQNITFVRWENGYKSAYSRAICRCSTDGFEWSNSVNDLINGGRGCPQCAEYGGYSTAKPGTLYVLRSECGSMVKIGISNNYAQRHDQLRRATPFDWSCTELVHSDDGAFIAELERELHNWTEQAEFSQPFDGYTEWRRWDDRLPMWIKRFRVKAEAL